MSTTSELSHLAVPINYITLGKNQLAQGSFEPGTSRLLVLYALPLRHSGWAYYKHARIWSASRQGSDDRQEQLFTRLPTTNEPTDSSAVALLTLTVKDGTYVLLTVRYVQWC